MEQIEFDSTRLTLKAWRDILAQKLQTASAFELHCWSDEPEWIEAALQFGVKKASSWSYGTIISGTITPQFSDFLLNLPKPSDTDLVNKMTPFFSIFLDNGFSSEHYGTELNQIQANPHTPMKKSAENNHP